MAQRRRSRTQAHALGGAEESVEPERARKRKAAAPSQRSTNHAPCLVYSAYPPGLLPREPFLRRSG